MVEETNDVTKEAKAFQKQKNKQEMQKQLITFALMIVFTLIAFGLVLSDSISKGYVVLILLVMAAVQAAFQFYYFMHMKEKDHEFPALLIYGGLWAAFLTLSGLVAISWW